MPSILGLDTWLRQSRAEDHGVIFEEKTLGLKLVSTGRNNMLAGEICPQIHS